MRIGNLFYGLIALTLPFALELNGQELNQQRRIKKESGQEVSSSLKINSWYDSYFTGSNYGFDVVLQNPNDVASLQMELYFDSSFGSINSLNNYVSDAIFDYRIDSEKVSLTYIFPTSLSEDTTLFNFVFQTDEKIGETDFDLAVLDANSSTGSLEVTGDNKKISIQKRNEKKYGYFYSYVVSKTSELRQGEEFTIQYSSYDLYDMAAGDFSITFDREVLEFISFEKGDFLNNSHVISEYHTSSDGNITLSFISSSSVSSSDFFTLRFKIKNNKTETTEIAMKSSSICDFQYQDFQNVEVRNTISTINDASLEEKAKMYITANKDEANKNLELNVSLEEGSNLAAGDFSLNFPREYFSYISNEDIHDSNIIDMLIINDTKSEDGQIDFHIINFRKNIIQATDILKIHLKLIDVCNNFITTISLNGEELCNLNSEPVSLDFPLCTIRYTGQQHSYGEWVVDTEPTCTEEGRKHRTCSECGRAEEESIPPLGHDLVHHDGKEPTCTEAGYAEYDECARCGYSTYEEIPAKGHSPSGPVRENVKDPTCNEDGGYDEAVYCRECHEELSRRHVNLPKTGHSYGEWVVDAEPTCTEEGRRHRTCSECGETEDETVPALGHDMVHHEGKDATCTEKGWKEYDSCNRCGHTTYEEIPAKGHSYGEWTTVKEPSFFEDGLMQRVCSDCKEKETSAIPRKDITPLVVSLSVGGAAVIAAGVVGFVLIRRRRR